MSQAEEIRRLAELRDQRILTNAEFNKKKQQILKGGKSGPSKFMTFVAGVVAFMIIAGLIVSIVEKVMANDLACDTPEVKEKVVVLVNQQIEQLKGQLGAFASLVPPGTQVLNLGATSQIYRDADSGFVACLAKTRFDKGEGDIGYTVSWRDRSAGEFWVQLADHHALAERYAATN